MISESSMITAEMGVAVAGRPQGWTPSDESNAWTSVLERDPGADKKFLYGVSTTGIYCRPSCPSRRPNRNNVRFFSSAEAAERAGFRACQRCRPNGGAVSRDASIERARKYIDAHLSRAGDERITLEVLAEHAGLSPHHLQRRFKAVVGVSPAQYMRARKTELLKGELRRGETVSRATYGAGYGSSSRLYEQASAHLGMTPAAYKRGGEGSEIRYVIQKTPLGTLLVAATDRGLCAVNLGDDVETLEAQLTSEYPAANIERDRQDATPLQKWVAQIVASLSGRPSEVDIPMDVQASSFKWRVWRELQKIPFGETRSYTDIAAAIGAPTAARAVASACANNKLALVIPCHRVVRQTGELGDYRWGLERKRALLNKERSARERSTS
jgi:AraC family transcriptional regulator, regulatory protein of adaptative response / methylated-DNA-[protein]-cysteine methyltransferase